MGEAVPWECIMNALRTKDRSRTVLSLGFWHMQEALREVLAVEPAM